MSNVDEASVPFIDRHGIQVALLTIYTATRGSRSTLIQLEPSEALEFGEAPVQLLESMVYEYVVSTPQPEPDVHYALDCHANHGIVKPSQIRNAHNSGRIEPGSYTGRLPLILKSGHTPIAVAEVEVRSLKLGYRDDYRQMLSDIAEYCADLVLTMRSPVVGQLTANVGRDPDSLQQSFFFLKYLLDTQGFWNALERILSLPNEIALQEFETISPQRGFQLTANTSRQLTSSGHRMLLADMHPLAQQMRQIGIGRPSVPVTITRAVAVGSRATTENCFVAHVLRTFIDFFDHVAQVISRFLKANTIRDNLDAGYSGIVREATALSDRLQSFFAASFLYDLPEPEGVPIGSPVLQRKGGYREILHAWLQFNLAATLTWNGGDDVYRGGKKNVATLYEYWLFLRLHELIAHKFRISWNVEDLIEYTSDGLALKLKMGRSIDQTGIYNDNGRLLSIRFSYNRTFSPTTSSTVSGTWTRTMRPDFTLTIWPSAFTLIEAQKQEIAVHIHLDAKYRIESLVEMFGDEIPDLNTEKEEQEQGRYKRADLLKMHTYKDAIHRTVGAYILYPGEKNQTWSQYHELLPGLGAFAIRPTIHGNTPGLEEFSRFLDDILQNLSDRITKREQLTYHKYQILLAPTAQDQHLFQDLPELDRTGHKRALPPVEHAIAIVQADDCVINWIQQNKLCVWPYSEHISVDLARVSHIAIHDCSGDNTRGLWKTIGTGLRVWLATDLDKLGYPSVGESPQVYVGFEVEYDSQFQQFIFDLSMLDSGAADGRNPNIITLAQLFATLQ